MRVQERNGEDWTTYVFCTTYRMGWDSVLFVIKALYPHIIEPEIFVSEIAGSAFSPAEIESEADLLNIPEAGVLRIRGKNKIYDEAPFQFTAYNQMNIVTMDVPTIYVDSMKKNETEYLDEEGKLHAFDLFMDSVELNAETARAVHGAVQNTADSLINALLMKENFTEHRVYRVNGNKVDLSEICGRIVENCKEVLCARVIDNWKKAPSRPEEPDSRKANK